MSTQQEARILKRTRTIRRTEGEPVSETLHEEIETHPPVERKVIEEPPRRVANHSMFWVIVTIVGCSLLLSSILTADLGVTPFSGKMIPSWPRYRLGASFGNALHNFLETKKPISWRLQDMLDTNRDLHAMYAAVKLEIPELVRNSPQDIETLARKTRTDEEALFRLMRYLSSRGIFDQEPYSKTFAKTRFSQLLERDHPESMAPMVLFMGSPDIQSGWNHLLNAVKSGTTGIEHVHGRTLPSLLSINKDLGSDYEDLLKLFSSRAATAIVSEYDFSSCSNIVDVGGGHGELLAEILSQNPRVQGMLFDQPAIALSKKTETLWTRYESIIPRLTLRAGDIFESVPANADCYILNNVLGRWSEDKMMTILRNVKSAAKSTSRVLILEPILDYANPFYRLAIGHDLDGLALSGGKEMILNEWVHFLQKAGFKTTKVVPTRSLLSIIEARPESR